jgi:hypothetical protein
VCYHESTKKKTDYEIREPRVVIKHDAEIEVSVEPSASCFGFLYLDFHDFVSFYILGVFPRGVNSFFFKLPQI